MAIINPKSGQLLHKTLRGYGLFAMILLLLSMPFFYGFLQKLHLDDVDEALALHKTEFETYIQSSLKVSEVSQWNRFNRDIKLVDSLRHLPHDSLFDHFYYDTLAHELEPYRVLCSPVMIQGKAYTLLIRQNLIEQQDLIMGIGKLFVGLLVLLLVGLFFLTQYFSKRVWQPFYETLAALEQFDITTHLQQRFRVSETSIEEFTRLNHILQGLIERIAHAYQAQREFIENAAHELQTPVAVLQTQLDIFLQEPTLNLSQTQSLTQLYESVARLNRLNRNLLLLSKLDRAVYQHNEQIALQALVQKQLTFFEEQALQKDVQLTIKTLDQVEISANLTLTEILVSNLFHNALRHNREHGKIEVELGKNSFIIRNTSLQEALAFEQLFQRFAQIEGPTSRNGLGLAIVKKIADLHGWHIGYSYENSQHIFEIRF